MVSKGLIAFGVAFREALEGRAGYLCILLVFVVATLAWRLTSQT